MRDARDEKGRSSEKLHAFELRMDRMSSWLRSELGFESESVGNVNRLLQETNQKVSEAMRLLRGEGDQMGIVGKVELLSKSWNIVLSVALSSFTGIIGFLLGKFMSDCG